ncbi:hypothetical protein CEXT_522481 [Caerostris extrusa]|uniref:Uncharacterized protein n=1 Tax=Caerostris extrusa TaxID=172846 RepID=A0AAV4Q5P5_CAEEX|nr:hypothetical protein CEXT_522481 [Caerostris extrusa]
MVPHSTFTSGDEKQRFVFLLGSFATVLVNNLAADLRGRTLRMFKCFFIFLLGEFQLCLENVSTFAAKSRKYGLGLFPPTALNSALQRKVEENSLGLLPN